MSALPSKADIAEAREHVRLGPIADMALDQDYHGASSRPLRFQAAAVPFAQRRQRPSPKIDRMRSAPR